METPGTTYILIDHENVPALDCGDIDGKSVKVLVFLGKQTTKLAVGDVKKLMANADKIRLVEMSGHGKNALDFHLAYYVGRITAEDPKARIHIVSKDTGFDPLIAHLREGGINAQRSAAIPKLGPAPKAAPKKKPAETAPPVPAPASAPPAEALVDRLTTSLTNNAKARPRKRKTLVSSVASQFKQLSTDQVEALIDKLAERGKITIDEQGAVTYQL